MPTRSAEDAVARVVAHIQTSIAEGRLAPGARLVEAQLTQALGTSRGPVREALRRLAAEGTVAIERHKGASIRKLTRADVTALYEVREVLEGLAARRAAGAALSKRRAIAAAFASLAQAAKLRDAARYAEANKRFHEAILAAAEHPSLPELVGRLRLPILRVQFRILLQNETIDRSQTDHARIMAAIEAGDGAKAEAAMRRHIAGAAATVAQLDDSVFG